MDLHNLDIMSDFLSSAPAMLGGPLFGGGRAGNSGRAQSGMGMSVSMAMRQVPTQPPPPHGQNEDYPGDLTASEAVKAVTQLLEASSRKLQRVTEDQGGETSRAGRSVEAMNVRLDRTGQQSGRTESAIPPVPAAAAQAILQARARDQMAADQEDSDIDAFSVDGDVEAFDEDDEDEAYYSDEEYDDEEYDEDGETYDGEESDYSHDGGSSCYDSEDEDADDEEHYPVAEVMPFHAPVRRKPSNDSTDQPPRQPNDPSAPPRPHYSTIPYLPGSRRNPVTGKQMREILDRLSPAARHNYQQALIREHQLEMEMQQTQQAPRPPPLAQQPVPPPPQDRQPSVLDDPAVMVSPHARLPFSPQLTLTYRIKRLTNCSPGSRPSYGRSNSMRYVPPVHKWRPRGSQWERAGAEWQRRRTRARRLQRRRPARSRRDRQIGRPKRRRMESG